MADPTPATIPQAILLAERSFRSGQFQQSEALCRQILAVDPHHAGAWHLMGLLALAAQRADLAVDFFSRSAASNPNHAQLQHDLGSTLLKLRRFDQAATALRRAIVLEPRYAAAYANLGIALHELGQTDAAMRSFRQALAIDPNQTGALMNLGNAFKLSGQFDQAVEAFRKTISVNPNSASAHLNLANVLKDCGQVGQAIDGYREATRLQPTHVGAHSALLLTMHCDPRFDAQTIHQEHRRWNELHALPLTRQANENFPNDHSSDRRLRVGYVSPDMRQHSVASFFEPLLENHHHDRFEIYCYADMLRPADQVTARLRQHASQWRDITGVSDPQVVEMIRNDRIDILVDLAGHTAGNRLLVFARKPAPIQATYLGYPDTTGLDAMDYRITDANADPPGLTESLHSEKLMRLHDTFLCYRAPQDAPPISDLPAKSTGQITFGSFNLLAKISEPIIAAWAQILQRVPKSKLVIKSSGLASSAATGPLLEHFAAHGIGPERLDLRGRIPSIANHLGLYSQIDIALDTFPYHGTTTTCEALWLGVPVVTIAGQTHVSRVGVSLLNNIGLPDLVAQNIEDYIRRAVELANDVARLSELRKTMRERMSTSPLMGAGQFAAAMEEAYREMWRHNAN